MTPDRPSSPGEIVLPREVVLASAGTGKTYTLSSRIIGLLAAGAPPDTLLASTFTRKAAGEILARVLSRLALASLDPKAAAELSSETSLSSTGRVPLNREGWGGILRLLVRDLHRANVGTLDSFFVRIAGSFPGELGLPPDWAITDEPTAQRNESEALQEVLSSARPSEMVELVRMTMRGEAGRGVHKRLLLQLKELRGLLHQQSGGNPADLWRPPNLRSDLAEIRMEKEDGPDEVIRGLERRPSPPRRRETRTAGSKEGWKTLRNS